MDPGCVASKADGLGSLSGIKRSLMSSEASEQCPAALVGQGATDCAILSLGGIGGHNNIIAYKNEENKLDHPTNPMSGPSFDESICLITWWHV